MDFRGLGGVLNGLVILVLIFVPLGLWKLIEIIIWAMNHINITIK